MPTLQPRAQVIRRDLSALACNNNEDECLTVDPLLIHDPQSRVGFVLKYITNLHLTFAQTRALPFLHTRLYRSNLPRTVMSAFCAATTYANRTESTKAWTYNLVAQATSDIQKDGAKAETVMDKLARTQALVIVETIRVFDGDFSLRHSAGKDRHILLEWHHELDRIREDMEIELGTPDVASREHPQLLGIHGSSSRACAEPASRWPLSFAWCTFWNPQFPRWKSGKPTCYSQRRSGSGPLALRSSSTRLGARTPSGTSEITNSTSSGNMRDQRIWTSSRGFS
uniref:Uncharacterized protein n=1 Tax=Bionectria ochroleuca TaxID=29856 RepID=A0A8H7NCZ1_BIOOC